MATSEILCLAVIRWFVLSLFLVFLHCGEKNSPLIQIVFMGDASAAFSDTSVVDLVLDATNIPVNNQFLDQDKDSLPDFFAFPRSCGATFPAQCGYSLTQSSVVSIGNLPLGFTYELRARFRNSSGTIKYQGSEQWVNNGETTTVSILIQEVP